MDPHNGTDVAIRAAMETLTGKRIAILATDGFEQSGLLQPRNALQDRGSEDSDRFAHRGNDPGMEGKELGRERDGEADR